MGERSLWWYVRVLALVLAGLYLAFGVIGGLTIHFDRSSDRAFWFVFLVAGAALLVAGTRLADRGRWIAALALTVGAILGALVLIWAVLPAIAAVVLIVLAVVWARRPPAATA